MQEEVLEFELICPVHGTHRTLVPVAFPRPRCCVHCFLPLTERREVRRFWIDPALDRRVGSEAYLG